MADFYTSVTLDAKRCKGCINCIKRCPTEAIRVRKGKAVITREKCVDCGECIRICPAHAKQSMYTKFEDINKFEYKIALPDQALYGQFNNLSDVNIVLTGLKQLGFDYVFETAAAAEYQTLKMKSYIEEHKDKWPLISAECPAVVRLISIRFPSLIEHIMPIISSMELAAYEARRRAMQTTGLPAEKIGVFAISPCPAKVTSMVLPLGIEKTGIDGVLAIKEIYPRLLNAMSEIQYKVEDLSIAGRAGIRWGSTSGQAVGVTKEAYIAADGIENVMEVLEELEGEKLHKLKFVELNACNGGCVGGALNVENPFIARAKLQTLRANMPEFKNSMDINDAELASKTMWQKEMDYKPVFRLGENIAESISLRAKVDELEKKFPGYDCGGCGAPSCRAFAQDIVRGIVNRTECPLIDSFKIMEDNNESN